MKTSQAESSKKQAKRSMEKVSNINKLEVSKDLVPLEAEIRDLAEIFFHQRIEKGEYGTAQDDWLKAEEYLKVSKESIVSG